MLERRSGTFALTLVLLFLSTEAYVFEFNDDIEKLFTRNDQSSSCASALGMESGVIKDSQITASSEWNSGHRSANGRLNFKAGSGRTGAWSARRNDKNQWLQIDLGNLTKITRIATQGRSDYNQWVTKYKLSFSRDGAFWNEYKEELSGNKDRSSLVAHNLNGDITARFVRVQPKEWRGHISMRVEIYGCRKGFEIPAGPKCRNALGMQDNKILNSQIIASSSWDSNHGPDRARLNTVKEGSKRGAWSARRNEKGQWIQINFPTFTKISGVATQGRQDSYQWVTSYKIQYSLIGIFFNDYNGGKTFAGNTDRDSIVSHILQQSIIVKAIRIVPISWRSHISMRFELFGCRNGFETPPAPKCLNSLNKNVSDSQLAASSSWDINHGPDRSRLNTIKQGIKRGAWSARYNRVGQWIQVDFRQLVNATVISTQGREDSYQWVKSYTLKYSFDGVFWDDYNDGKPLSGNNDRNSVVSHLLKPSIVARAIRVVPASWHHHMSMRFGFYGCTKGFETPSIPQCQRALGMENKNIQDWQVTASSSWPDGNHGPERARLNTKKQGIKGGSWLARHRDKGQWIKLEFQQPTKITGISTQGRPDSYQWVTAYRLQFSRSGGHFEDYNEGKVFSGNSDRDTVVTHVIEPAIIAKAMKIIPTSWRSHIAMRFELYGCTEGFSVPGNGSKCSFDLLTNGSQLFASSQWHSSHGQENAILHHQHGDGKTGAWSSRYNDGNQWLHVDLGQVSKVTILAIQGRSDHRQWVKTFTVSFSVFGRAFQNVMNGKSVKVFPGNTDQYTVVSNKLDVPVIAKYIRFHPKSWQGHVSMRIGIFGCQEGVEIPKIDCGLPLGLQSKIVADCQISASSELNRNSQPRNARLHFEAGSGRVGGWLAKANDQNQWLQVDFGAISKIMKCATQGRSEADQWVTKYKLSFSRDGPFWTFYDKELAGNKDRSTVVTNVLDPVLYARFVRVHPVAWRGLIAMRVEFYGCRSGFKTPQGPKCQSALGMENKKITDSQIIASSSWDLNHGPDRSRLNTIRQGIKQGAWSSRRRDQNQWIEVDFPGIVNITAIVTQGRQDSNQWVKSYKLRYNVEGRGGYFKKYMDEKIFDGNNDRDTMVGHVLEPAIQAKSIRILPLTWHGHISMRFELYGCK